MPRVAVLVADGEAYAREVLLGIARHQSETRHPWALQLCKRARTEVPRDFLRQWQGEGIIAQVDSEELRAALVKTGLPVVNVSGALEHTGFPSFVQDADLAARLAVECFVERGFRHFTYVGFQDHKWSVERGESFARQLQDRGHACAALWLPARAGGSSHTVGLIQRFLREQRHPLAVWACNDDTGVQVMNACLLARLSVPEDVAVLGVDNDETVTLLASPSLSSVATNGCGAGYRAAGLLHDWLQGKVPDRKLRQQLPPQRIHHRGSTHIFAVDDPHVALALRLIEQRACTGLREAELI